MRPMARPKIGDICETEARGRLLYVQLTHRHPEYGELIRVLAGPHDERPADLPALAREPDLWRGFYPLNAAVRQKLMTVVAHALVPPERVEFPTFKSDVRDPRTDEIAHWWLWDGEREWRVNTLTPEQQDFPNHGIVNHVYLIGEILGHAPAEPPADPRPTHYVYFGDEASARRAASEVEGEVDEAADGNGWVLKARGHVEDEVVAVAERHGGEYDGSEVPVRWQG